MFKVNHKSVHKTKIRQESIHSGLVGATRFKGCTCMYLGHQPLNSSSIKYISLGSIRSGALRGPRADPCWPWSGVTVCVWLWKIARGVKYQECPPSVSEWVRLNNFRRAGDRSPRYVCVLCGVWTMVRGQEGEWVNAEMNE